MKSKPPIIAITTAGNVETKLFCVRDEYVKAVRLAGGIPVLLPPGEPDLVAILERIDGLIFTGGGDIDPAVYNGETHPTIYNVDPQRDRSELALAKLVLETNIPILGICRGLEVLVVAEGGDLVPHLPDEFGEAIAHRSHQSRPSEHEVQIASESRLAKLIGVTEAKVVSWHHQAVHKVPEGWKIVASSADGVIEALECKCHPWAIALQWHPELSLNDPQQQQIFQAFIAAAKSYNSTVRL